MDQSHERRAKQIELAKEKMTIQLPVGVFLKGETVIWAPARVRQKCYGHPIGLAPVECEIQSGPDKRGNYVVKILNKKAKVWLRKKHYTVMPISLRKINNTR